MPDSRSAAASRSNVKPASTREGLDALARLGIRRPEELLLHLPLRYEDHTRLVSVASLRPGDSGQFEGIVRSSRVETRGRRVLLVEVADDSGSISLRFLNFYPSQVGQLTAGVRIRAHGEVRGGLFGPEMIHPRYRVVKPGTPLPKRLTPVYPSVAGISQLLIRTELARVRRTLRWTETVDAGVIRILALPTIAQALDFLHEPPADVAMQALEARELPAWRRVIFDELLAQQLSLRRAREARAAQQASAVPTLDLVQRLTTALPFQLTAAQRRAWSEVSRDLARAQPMNRLLQGDVGSGKTVVAALAAAQAVGSSHQAALMAPTEILAEQHLRKLTPWLEPLGIRVGWLAGSLRESEKRAVRAAVAAGEIDLLVGTHALIESGVQFSRLGLAIVDEQHRFGVAQRLALRAGDSGQLAHQLMMSATPIPRTLAMSYYADLDVSVIDELPPGRTPVDTRVLPESRRGDLIERVRAAAEQGRQVYWVCPLVEESEALDLQTAIDTHAALSEALQPLSVGLVHGRLSSSDKQAVMDGFNRGEIQVLVATTVIEVGVDVPNASLMVIEHAERFGLAQLHQLRGRVGRGATRSACVLLYYPPLSPAARERLQVMHDTTDGFEIARHDLRQRGPGEFLGARQSGQALLRFADLERDADLVEAARDCAALMLREHPEQAATHVARWLGEREDYLKA
jgi:ATP-dependent DNA helicase RecG